MRRIILLLLLVLPSYLVAISPATMSPGRGYIWNGLSITTFSQLQNGTGEKSGARATFIKNQLYFIYGIVNNVSAYIGGPFISSSSGGVSDTGVGDGRLGLKVRLLNQKEKAPLSIALASAVKVPLSNYGVTTVGSFGAGQIDGEFALIMGRSFGSMVLNFGGGYRARADEPSDQYFMALTFGLKHNYRWKSSLNAGFTNSFEGHDYLSTEFLNALATDGTHFTGLKTSYVNVSLKSEYSFTKKVTGGLSVSQIVYARNAAVATDFGASFGYLL